MKRTLYPQCSANSPANSMPLRIVLSKSTSKAALILAFTRLTVPTRYNQVGAVPTHKYFRTHPLSTYTSSSKESGELHHLTRPTIGIHSLRLIQMLRKSSSVHRTICVAALLAILVGQQRPQEIMPQVFSTLARLPVEALSMLSQRACLNRMAFSRLS